MVEQLPRKAFGLPLLAEPVPVSPETLDLVRAGVGGLWQRIVKADPAANNRPLLLSYDVHPSPEGPVLIEVNTNAGGVATALQAAAQINTCCPDWERQILEQRLIDLFKQDLLGAGDAGVVLAIVDDQLDRQTLLPEMHSLAELLKPYTKAVIVVDASALRNEDGRLRHSGIPIDCIYWRSTDFLLSDSGHQDIRRAVENGSTALAPSAEAYSAIADKRRFIEWSADPVLARNDASGLSFSVATTVPMSQKSGMEWQADRANWVFKPSSGYASRGVYVGKSISKQKLAELPAQEYLAQRYTPHPTILRDGRPWKYDLRFYANRGKVIAAAARVFQGQVVGMREPGSGFAPVKVGATCCLSQALLVAA